MLSQNGATRSIYRLRKTQFAKKEVIPQVSILLCKKKILFCFCTLYSQMMQVMKQAGQFLFLSFLFPIHVFCKLGIFFHIYSSFLANFAVIKCTIQIDSSNFLHSQNIKFYTLIQYRILAYFRFIFVVFD